ncbi:hypothetical protein A1O3_08445 [Capronia epimyces CBS 606.96]|uniref:Uncharacterized protein n=1 Tax=Capronia epimyces CBS 606.96 TaxID=1182542 RepID=W9XNQ1_9EURO|nr:uncharacterized protein A1O3_08445 [Capronia epimyces CBS 606.96]EXJ78945.1 hypothetical protein A1O3_08445 [Capronia epimyces CBS 606.96]
MCESHTIHHICGHAKFKTLVQCADMIDRLVASHLLVSCSHHLCDDIGDNPHIFPDICDSCKRSAVIADWIDQQPGGKFEVLRAWRRQNRPQSNSSEEPEAAHVDHGADMHEMEMEAAETLSEVPVSDCLDISASVSVSTADSASPSPPAPSSVQSAWCSAPSDHAKTAEPRNLKKRLASLTTRADRLIARIRAKETETATVGGTLDN